VPWSAASGWLAECQTGLMDSGRTGLREPLYDVDVARRLVRKIKRSRWWRENVVEHAGISLELGGEEFGEDRITSYARPDADYLPQLWTISVHPDKGQVPGHSELSPHGARFAGAMAWAWR
jgi:hypothetical protein